MTRTPSQRGTVNNQNLPVGKEMRIHLCAELVLVQAASGLRERVTSGCTYCASRMYVHECHGERAHAHACYASRRRTRVAQAHPRRAGAPASRRRTHTRPARIRRRVMRGRARTPARAHTQARRAQAHTHTSVACRPTRTPASGASPHAHQRQAQARTHTRVSRTPATHVRGCRALGDGLAAATAPYPSR